MLEQIYDYVMQSYSFDLFNVFECALSNNTKNNNNNSQSANFQYLPGGSSWGVKPVVVPWMPLATLPHMFISIVADYLTH